MNNMILKSEGDTRNVTLSDGEAFQPDATIAGV